MSTPNPSSDVAASTSIVKDALAEALRTLLKGRDSVECFRIRFKSGDLHEVHGDKEFVCVGGAIATRADFNAFRESMCHLSDDGVIRRYGVSIGVREDIDFLGPMDESPTP